VRSGTGLSLFEWLTLVRERGLEALLERGKPAGPRKAACAWSCAPAMELLAHQATGTEPAPTP